MDIPPQDFLIDEIHCCEADSDNVVATYVFAISPEKHNFEGIVTNTLMEEHTTNLFATVIRVKNNILKTLQIVRANFSKHAAHH